MRPPSRASEQAPPIDDVALYTRMIEYAMDAILAVDDSERIVLFNGAATRLFGCEASAALGLPLDRFLIDRPGCSKDAERPRNAGSHAVSQVTGLHASGVEIPLEASFASVAPDHRLRIAILRDATDRRRLEAELRREHDLAVRLADIARAIVLVLDCDGRILRFNSFMQELSGYALEEVQGRDWFETFIPPGDAPRIRSVFSRAIRQIHTQGNVNPILRKDGSQRLIEWWDTELRDDQGSVEGLLCIGHDITDRVEAEQRARQAEKAAAASAALAEDRERRRLAGELHDGLSQLLAVAGLKLALARDLDGSSARATIDEVRSLLADAQRQTTALSFELSPPLLHSQGLAAAAQDLAQALRQQYGLVVEIDDDGHPKPLEEAARTALYRALRELLVNVARHSGAREARARLRRIPARPGRESEQDWVQITVEDEGDGFDPDVQSGLGLLLVRERLASVEGRLTIRTAPGAGTEICASVPLPLDA